MAQRNLGGKIAAMYGFDSDLLAKSYVTNRGSAEDRIAFRRPVPADICCIVLYRYTFLDHLKND